MSAASLMMIGSASDYSRAAQWSRKSSGVSAGFNSRMTTLDCMDIPHSKGICKDIWRDRLLQPTA
jgi:hypothetical protein